MEMSGIVKTLLDEIKVIPFHEAEYSSELKLDEKIEKIRKVAPLTYNMIYELTCKNRVVDKNKILKQIDKE